MLTGRAAGGSLLRVIAAQRLFPLALLVTSLGFLIYWGLRGRQWPLWDFLCSASGWRCFIRSPSLCPWELRAHEPTPRARAALAGCLGILVTPALLGGLADKVGLSLAHLIVPGLVVVALICFVTAQALQRRRMLTA